MSEFTDISAMLAITGRVCIGLVFLSAGLRKLRHSDAFLGVIANYRVLPRSAVRPFSTILPWFELALGSTLLSQVRGPAAACAAIVVLIGFACAIGVNLYRGRLYIDCGCGRSDLRQVIHWHMVFRNAALSIMLIPAMLHTAQTQWTIVLLGGIIGIALYVLYILYGNIAALSDSYHRQDRIKE